MVLVIKFSMTALSINNYVQKSAQQSMDKWLLLQNGIIFIACQIHYYGEGFILHLYKQGIVELSNLPIWYTV